MSVPVNVVSHLSFPETREIILRQVGEGVAECSLNFASEPKFSPAILREIASVPYRLERGEFTGIRHAIFTSSFNNVFSLGGDLKHFIDCINSGDKQALLDYANLCVECVYNTATGLGSDINTIAVVSGTAFGGGFEAVLSCDYIIAEEGSSFGFPETLFNMFPGMGAHVMLARKIDYGLAERMISNAGKYDAQQLLEMGVIDKVVPRGEGMRAALNLTMQIDRKQASFNALRRVRQLMKPVDLGQLEEIARIWVDNAMELSSKDIRHMERLARSQETLDS